MRTSACSLPRPPPVLPAHPQGQREAPCRDVPSALWSWEDSAEQQAWKGLVPECESFRGCSFRVVREENGRGRTADWVDTVPAASPDHVRVADKLWNSPPCESSEDSLNRAPTAEDIKKKPPQDRWEEQRREAQGEWRNSGGGSRRGGRGSSVTPPPSPGVLCWEEELSLHLAGKSVRVLSVPASETEDSWQARCPLPGPPKRPAHKPNHVPTLTWCLIKGWQLWRC